VKLRSSSIIILHTIRPVKTNQNSTVARLTRIEPFLLGTVLSGVSSLGYSCSNVCLRWLAHCDPLLVSCIKAVPTLFVATALVYLSVARRTMRWPSMPAFLGLATVGIIAQLGGNGFFQWSMGEVGLALTVPLCAGTMIIAATILGRVWLREAVTPRSALALAILISAIVVLSVGAERAPQLAELSTADASITAALAAACFSGISYAVLNVTIRRLVTGSMPMSLVLSTVSAVGVVSLGLVAIARTGWAPLAATAPSDLGVMFIAGSFNAVGFFTLTKALQLVSIVQVNAVSASQSALAAIAGVAIFGESMTTSLVFGVSLTILGLTLVDRGRKMRTPPDSGGSSAAPNEQLVAISPLQLPGSVALPREPTTT
jgi:drug/metabolite transporter (DMT)-like permease